MKLRTLAFAALVLAMPLASSSVAAAAGSKLPPPPKFPVSADVFRTYSDKLIGSIRDVCNAHCNAKQRSDFEGAVSQVRVRVMEACRDGTVTETEADYAMAPLDAVGNEQGKGEGDE
ncbi:hypothetical protein BH09MYX1_BH09MYX1_06070 [soil metagenome]